MASPASSNDLIRREIFLPHPPLPFDCDHEGDECRNHDTDEDWLPEVKDIFNGNFHVMIDMTSDLDSEDEAKVPSRYTRSDLKTCPAATTSTRLQSAAYGQRLSRACQPLKAANSIDSESAEIPESPRAVQVRPAVSGPSDHCNDRDGGGELAPITTITKAVTAHTEENSNVEEQQQDQEKEEKEEEETDNDGGSFPSRGQPKAPILTSTVGVLESSLTSARRGQEAVQGCCPRTQITSPITSPAREVACTESCIGIQDITFLRVEGQRETADGPEYGFVAKMWLRPGAGIPSNLVNVYRRDVARQARLATLRTRKRTSTATGVVKGKLMRRPEEHRAGLGLGVMRAFLTQGTDFGATPSRARAVKRGRGTKITQELDELVG